MRPSGISASGVKPLEIWAVSAVAITVGCLPALMPILLGALLEEHRISPDEVGQIATAEALGRVLANLVAGAMLRPVRLRGIAAAASAVIIASSFAIIFADPNAILLARFLNGIAAGMILWLLIGLMARVNQPGQMFALYVAIQSVVTFILSSLLTTHIVPNWGSSGGYLALAMLGTIPLVLSVLVPRQYPRHPQHAATGMPSPLGLIGLGAVFLFMAGIFAFWVYVGAIAQQAGHSPANASQAINYAIGIQIMAGLTAMRLADRWNGAVTTALTALALAGCALMLLYVPQMWSLYFSTGAVAFLWMFTPAFHLPMLLHLDRTGKAAIYSGSAQLGGIAAGPVLASTFVQRDDFTGAVATSVALFLACALLLLVSWFVGVKKPLAVE